MADLQSLSYVCGGAVLVCIYLTAHITIDSVCVCVCLSYTAHNFSQLHLQLHISRGRLVCKLSLSRPPQPRRRASPYMHYTAIKHCSCIQFTSQQLQCLIWYEKGTDMWPQTTPSVHFYFHINSVPSAAPGCTDLMICKMKCIMTK